MSKPKTPKTSTAKVHTAPAPAATATPKSGERYIVLEDSPEFLAIGLTRSEWRRLEERGAIRLLRAKAPAGPDVLLLPVTSARKALQALVGTPGALTPAPACELVPLEIAPGVTLTSFFGEPWPITLTMEAIALDYVFNQRKRPGVRINARTVDRTPEFRGEIYTFDGVSFHDGKHLLESYVPVPGSRFKATVAATLRAKPNGDTNEPSQPDYTRPPIIVAKSVYRIDQPVDMWGLGFS